MAEDETPETAVPPAPAVAAPAKPPARRRAKAAPKAGEAPAKPTEAEPAKKKDDGPRAPKRADLPAEKKTLLLARREIDRRRPLFGRQARYRYYRIGRDLSWRRPRGLQSKQRRHYGYRPKIVRIGYRSPAKVRGLVPSGFRPVIVRTDRDLEAINAKLEAAVIARAVGTRRRLVLEEAARKLGIHVLNPIVKSEQEA
ncbi:MAG TPA: 50S ribosomal protein L32e [Thermoplasmata archaeon]|nr:50S ribosomal protein L32e [Thermoplasmata archaeon]